jgi:hypothetical protein
MADDRAKGTFGRVFTEEREQLLSEGFDGGHILVLLAIRSLGNGDSTRAFTKTMAQAVGLPWSTFQLKMKELVARGAVQRPGVAHSKRETTIIPVASWQTLATGVSVERQTPAARVKTLATSVETLDREHKTAHKRNNQRNEESLSGPSDLERLAEEWRTTRVEHGLEKWADRSALTYLRDGATRALKAGCSREDLQRAVGAHVEDEWADTREFDQWAIDARDERLKEERWAEERRQRRIENLTHEIGIERDYVEKEAKGDPTALARRRNRGTSASERVAELEADLKSVVTREHTSVAPH